MEPVQIGVKELYDLLKEVDTKLDAQHVSHALLEQRVTSLERREDKVGDRRWLAVLALTAALVSLVCAFIAPVIVR